MALATPTHVRVHTPAVAGGKIVDIDGASYPIAEVLEWNEEHRIACCSRHGISRQNRPKAETLVQLMEEHEVGDKLTKDYILEALGALRVEEGYRNWTKDKLLPLFKTALQRAKVGKAGLQASVSSATGQQLPPSTVKSTQFGYPALPFTEAINWQPQYMSTDHSKVPMPLNVPTRQTPLTPVDTEMHDGNSSSESQHSLHDESLESAAVTPQGGNIDAHHGPQSHVLLKPLHTSRPTPPRSVAGAGYGEKSAKDEKTLLHPLETYGGGLTSPPIAPQGGNVNAYRSQPQTPLGRADAGGLIPPRSSAGQGYGEDYAKDEDTLLGTLESWFARTDPLEPPTTADSYHNMRMLMDHQHQLRTYSETFDKAFQLLSHLSLKNIEKTSHVTQRIVEQSYAVHDEARTIEKEIRQGISKTLGPYLQKRLGPYTEDE